MPRGPAPLPKHILEARGSRSVKPREEIGVRLGGEPPEPPSWLSERAKALYVDVCRYLIGMGNLAESDVNVIVRYSTVFERWERAEQQLAAGAVDYVEVKDKNGEFRFSRPSKWMTQANASHEQLRQLETVLGLTPADRTRLGYGAQKIVRDEVDDLFDD